MSQKANYFKLGLFVISAIVAGVAVLVIIGTGRFFERRITIETYFKESVQGLDVGSKLKYRGVVIGEVTKISFTYTTYQLDLPMTQRDRFVMVLAQLQPRLVGGRAAAGDMTSPENAQMEVERGLRLRLAPQGITGHQLSRDGLSRSAAAGAADLLDADQRLHPERAVDGDHVRERGAGHPESPAEPGRRRHGGQSQPPDDHRQRSAGVDRHEDAVAARRPRARPSSRPRSTGCRPRRSPTRRRRCSPSCAQSNAELRKTLASPALQKLPDDAAAAIASVKTLVSDPKLAKTIADMERIMARFDRLFGRTDTDLGTTIENLRQITDNLRDLTEDTKRYPASVLFGAPPAPLERKP